MSIFPPLLELRAFSRSFVKAISSILTCFPKDSWSLLAVRASPSKRAILDFISALSISQALRSRSWRCHSVWRKRITPSGGSVSYVGTCGSCAHPGECIRCPQEGGCHLQPRHQLHPFLPLPWQSLTARPCKSLSRLIGRPVICP
jgi:hypothetical protein